MCCRYVQTKPGVVIKTHFSVTDRKANSRPDACDRAPEDYNSWLDPNCSSESIQPLLQPFPEKGMKAWPVSSMVNSPKNDVPGCIQRIE